MSKVCLWVLTCVVAVGAAVAQAAEPNGEEDGCRMVVAAFRAANGGTFTWCGRKESTAMWASALADKLNERLTQTRAFVMIDRKFDTEVQDEIARLSARNAATGDVVRLGRRLGTDYMIVGDVRFADVQPPAVSPITGQTVATLPQRFAEIGYRVVLVATGRIAWAETVVVTSDDAPAADVLSFVSMSADTAARRIAEAVVANLSPAAAACNETRTPVRTPAASPGTSVRGTGNGGVITPF